MNRQQAKEIAALSADAYAQIRLYHQQWLKLYGEGVGIECRLNPSYRFTKPNPDSFEISKLEWRLKSDTQIINGIACAGPLKSWPRDLVIVYMEAPSLSDWQIEIKTERLTNFKQLLDRGIIYDTAYNAATACKLRHGVAP